MTVHLSEVGEWPEGEEPAPHKPIFICMSSAPQGWFYERWMREQNMYTDKQIEEIFTYHSPSSDQLPKYQAIRDAAKAFALVVVKNTDSSPDQSAVIRKIREAVMTANASIALNGKY
jgi:hypothetical protein